MNTYIEYDFKVSPKEPATEILIAELGYAGFESFVENENGVQAYILQEEWNKAILEDIYVLQSNEFSITYTHKVVEQVNWNKEWEKNFNPILIENKVFIRAPFHEAKEVDFEIIIEPKMSFGTGHHQTTHMMVKHLLKLDLENKKVLDMGSGTGVLAILAEMRGAKPLDAIDIDNWCYLNAVENVERNHCKHITCYEGDASLLVNKKYEIIIANINRNILLNDMQTYCNCLEENGTLLLSGFYQEDIPIIDAEVSKHGLKLHAIEEMKNWVALRYTKG